MPASIAKVCSVLVCFVSVSFPTSTAATAVSLCRWFPTFTRVMVILTDMQDILEGIVGIHRSIVQSVNSV